MKLLSVPIQHSTYTEIKYLYFFCNLKWWKGTMYFRFRVYYNYIMPDIYTTWQSKR